MGNYTVSLADGARKAPPLLNELGDWLRQQPYGSVGHFELVNEEVPREWDPANAERLQKAARAFVHLPDGSMLALLTREAKQPAAVVLLGSEGETATVALSLEAFLGDLARGETGVGDLDERGTAREALASWLADRKVKAPRAKAFDFDSWLAGKSSRDAPAAAPPPSVSPEIAALSPKLSAVARLVGRRADDRELLAYITGTLGAKPPKNTTAADSTAYVVAKKHGIEMAFSHEIDKYGRPRGTTHPKYPPIALTPRAFVPYLEVVWLRDKFGEKLPDGILPGMSADRLPALLGKPSGTVGLQDVARPVWKRVLDKERGVVLQVAGWEKKGAEVTLKIADV